MKLEVNRRSKSEFVVGLPGGNDVRYIICGSVHWYAYISTHCTHVSTAIANSIHGFACV